MSLRFVDAWKLSTTSIVQHKGRSAVIVLSVAVLFGALMGLNFLVGGIRRTVLLAGQQKTGGSVYLTVRPLTGSGTWFYNDLDGTDEWREHFKIEMGPGTREAITRRGEEYHSEVVGQIHGMHLGFPYYIVSDGAVRDLVDFDLSEVPEGKVPVLVREDVKEDFKEPEEQKFFEDNFYVVGELPNTVNMDDPDYPGRTVGWPVMPGGNPLNLLLENVDGGSRYPVMLVDDGSGKVDEFVTSQVDSMIASNDFGVLISFDKPALVVKFSNINDAIDYSMLGSYQDFTELMTHSNKYEFQDFFGGVHATAYDFNRLRMTLFLIEVAVFAVAVIVAILIFRHLIDQEAATIALYRSMGATTKDIYLIYFLHLMNLILLAVLACLIVAFSLIGIVALLNYAELGATLREYYNFTEPPKLYFYAFDGYFWAVIVAILLVAPLTLGFSTHCFSPKYIAKKLKEDLA